MFALQTAYIFFVYCIIVILLCWWIKHSKWHCRRSIQFDYCFLFIGLCIYIYEYGMLSMDFDCCLERFHPTKRIETPVLSDKWVFLHLYNPTHIPGPVVRHIRQVSLFLLLIYCNIYYISYLPSILRSWVRARIRSNKSINLVLVGSRLITQH